MTLLAGGLTTLIAFVFATGLSLVGRAAALDARAQLAADAAALAAVSEAAPGGSGLPISTAKRFAELNDAELVQCICKPGALAVQVTVAIDGVSARARAELDPSLLMPVDLSADVAGLQPEMRSVVTRLLSDAGAAVRVVSGYRDSDQQSRLWAAALATYGDAQRADDWVARPGGSMHERGLAVDLGGDLALAVRTIAELDLPLVQPLANEPWHFELAGARR